MAVPPSCMAASLHGLSLFHGTRYRGTEVGSRTEPQVKKDQVGAFSQMP